MGLHHRFPSYFYKRGNLFNTYLSHSDASESPPKKKARKPASKPRKQTASPRPFQPNASAQRLVDFCKCHMSAEEACRFLSLISAHRGLELRAVEAEVWDQLAYFTSTCLSRRVVDRYLETLEQRQRSRARLIQRQIADGSAS